jgi:hypothetical protein
LQLPRWFDTHANSNHDTNSNPNAPTMRYWHLLVSIVSVLHTKQHDLWHWWRGR